MKPAVFLDRDGTLNRCFPHRDGKTRPPATLADLRLTEGAMHACGRLREAGYLLLVVTNQPDVRRGTQSRHRVEELNERLRELLGLDDLVACYHDDVDGCGCRKPKPGMILALAERHHVDLGKSYMVGDRCTDVVAGRSAGCNTVLVSEPELECGQDLTVPTLLAAADRILLHSNKLHSNKQGRGHHANT